MEKVIKVEGYKHIELFYDEEEDKVITTTTPVIGFEYRSINEEEIVKTCILNVISMFNVEGMCNQWNIIYGVQDPNGLIIVPELEKHEDITSFEESFLEMCRKRGVR